MKRQKPDATQKMEERLRTSGNEAYVLRLYVTGMTPKSLRAIENMKKICETHLSDRYQLEVIDIYQQPVLAKGDQIIAAPTLIKKLPLPLRKFIGDMSNTEKILLGLNLRPSEELPKGTKSIKKSRSGDDAAASHE